MATGSATIFSFPSSKTFIFPAPIVERNARLPGEIILYEDGTEQRNQPNALAQFGFTLRGEGAITETDTRSALHFYSEMQGNLRTFYWQDPTAPNPTAQVVGKGNGHRRLFKAYGDRVTSIAAYIDGVNITAGSAAGVTVSLTNATFTFATAPAVGLLITCDVRSEQFLCRFLQPLYNQEYFAWRLVRNQIIELIQEK